MLVMDTMINELDLKSSTNAPGATVALNSALKSCSISKRCVKVMEAQPITYPITVPVVVVSSGVLSRFHKTELMHFGRDEQIILVTVRLVTPEDRLVAKLFHDYPNQSPIVCM